MLVPKEERLACKSEQLLLEEELASSDIFGSVPNGLLNNGAAVSEAFKNDDSNSSFAFVKPEFKEEVYIISLLDLFPIHQLKARSDLRKAH